MQAVSFNDKRTISHWQKIVDMWLYILCGVFSNVRNAHACLCVWSKYLELSWDIARSDSELCQLDDSYANGVGQRSSIDEDSTKLVDFAVRHAGAWLCVIRNTHSTLTLSWHGLSSQLSQPWRSTHCTCPFNTFWEKLILKSHLSRQRKVNHTNFKMGCLLPFLNL